MRRLVRWLLTPWRRYKQRRAWKNIAKAMLGPITMEKRAWFRLRSPEERDG